MLGCRKMGSRPFGVRGVDGKHRNDITGVVFFTAAQRSIFSSLSPRKRLTKQAWEGAIKCSLVQYGIPNGSLDVPNSESAAVPTGCH